MANVQGNKVTSEEFDDLSTPMHLDLIAAFNQFQEIVMKKVNEGEKEGWTPEKLINEIEKAI
jgi:hypothetical protein